MRYDLSPSLIIEPEFSDWCRTSILRRSENRTFQKRKFQSQFRINGTEQYCFQPDNYVDNAYLVLLGCVRQNRKMLPGFFGNSGSFIL